MKTIGHNQPMSRNEILDKMREKMGAVQNIFMPILIACSEVAENILVEEIVNKPVVKVMIMKEVEETLTIKKYREDAAPNTVYNCKNCNNHNVYQAYSFCPKCGIKIKWV